MKIDELKPCSLCGGEVVPMFYTVKVQQHGVRVDQINRIVGLAQHFYGGAPGLRLAQVMGDDTHVTQALGKEEEFVVCNKCMIDNHIPLAGEFFERVRSDDG